MTPDLELLNRYATQRDEAAFSELARRHLDHVYSAALRLVGGDTHLAEDVTQTVFADLARKAKSVRDCPALSGWLHTSARFAAAKIVRAEQRRRRREETVFAMPEPPSEPEWEQMRSVLDATIGELGAEDRDALLLRYFEKKTFSEIGAALGASENAARMRVERALDKLRVRLAGRGITSAAAMLGTALAEHAVCTAPATLGARVVSHALAVGTSGTWFGSIGLAGKFAVAAASVLMVASLPWLLKTTSLPEPSASEAALPSSAANVSGDSAVASSEAAPAKAAVQSRHGLELYFVDNQTGRPITNQVIGLRGWRAGVQVLVEEMVPLKKGRCRVPFGPIAGSAYWILTRMEGYADVRLRWDLPRGETLPQTYTVRLVRPVLIHGRVVDSAGNPVAGAEVAFGCATPPANEGSPEDHTIDRLTALADSEGCWRIHRIAPDLVPYLVGEASHPQFSGSPTLRVANQPEAARQLLDGTFEFRLNDGFTVRGMVRDSAGRPVANATVRVGMLHTTGTRESQTDVNGNFYLAGCRPGKEPITAEMEGFAPDVVSLDIGSNTPPVTLTLGAGRPLRIRVVNPAGQPIAMAEVYYSPQRPELKESFPQVEFRGKSDSAGRVVWEHAPDQKLHFGFHASGYRSTDYLVLPPSSEEHVITLESALVILGTVRDAETGELLPRFRLGFGYPARESSGTDAPYWSTLDRFWPEYTGGEFRYALRESLVRGSAIPGYIVRFEAEDYAPQVTRTIQPDEGEVRLDIRLRPAPATAIMVYTPGGRPAAEAHVGLLAPGHGLQLGIGGYCVQFSLGSSWLKRTDANGQFRLPADKAVRHVVAAHPQGYAEISVADLLNSRTIRLRPWSRVEGVWQSRGQPVSHGYVALQWNSIRSDAPGLQYEIYTVRTDAAGRFVFPQAPPGSLKLQTWVKEDHSNYQDTGKFDVAPGETRQITLGDTAGE